VGSTACLGAALGAVVCLAIGCTGDGGRSAPSPSPTATTAPSTHRKVFLEVDQMAGTPPLPLERDVGGTRVTLEGIYADAGLDLDVRRDQADLPRKDAVTLADLDAMMVAFHSLTPPPDAMYIHLLVVTRDQDDPDTLGIMFDLGDEDTDNLPREGFAMFADAHQGLPTDAPTEMLLTAAHELGHCFNLHHADWEGRSFKSGSTIEGYSLADTVLWRLSQVSKSHLSGDPGPEVWPGKKSLAFGLITSTHQRRHQTTPLEAFDVVEPDDVPKNQRGTHVHNGASSRETRDRSRFRDPASQSLKLRLETEKRSYVLGEPVVLTVGLHNEGTRPMRVVPLLGPEYRFLAIEVRAPGTERFEPFHPALLADGRRASARVLAPGESLHDEAKIFFGAEGWTFSRPGTWVIRADFPAGGSDDAGFDEGSGRIQSEPLAIDVVSPRSAPEQRAKELIWGPQQGLYLLLGGGDHLKKARAQLTRLANETPAVAQAPAVRLALGLAALNPTIDPATKVQSAPRLDEAKRLLRPTLDAPLPPLSVAQAQTALAQKLERAGQTADANQVRRDATRKLAGKESAQKALEKLRREEH
jgi:hypothetical protein